METTTMMEIQAKLESETAVPDGYCRTIIGSKLLIYKLHVDSDVPQLPACISLHQLSVSIRKSSLMAGF